MRSPDPLRSKASWAILIAEMTDDSLPTVLTVHELTAYIKRLLDQDEVLQDVIVRGEVSNFKRHRSGHLYFTLKDEHAALDCVCFRNVAQGLDFAVEDGMEVVAGGRVTVYEKQGRYQLVVLFIRPDGVGALYAAFERLRAKLEAEGLFDPSRKRPLPRFPKCIALVTSPTGAAVRDLTTIISRRYPLARIIIIPTIVQGDQAPASIVHSLSIANSIEDVDLIVVGRGGGSIEDLWAFNDEQVARAIFASSKPTISAVGHETDVTIADLVADLRAATPSAAAELAVPDARELLQHLENLASRGTSAMQSRLHRAESALARLASRSPLRAPATLLEQWLLRVDEAWERAGRALATAMATSRERLRIASARLWAHRPRALLQRRADRAGQLLQRAHIALAHTVSRGWARLELAAALAAAHHPSRLVQRRRESVERLELRGLAAVGRAAQRAAWRLEAAAGRLAALNPRAVLERGYSITMRLPDEEVVRSANQVQPEDLLRIILAHGELQAEATGSMAPPEEAEDGKGRGDRDG